jgi:hypothetical protein
MKYDERLGLGSNTELISQALIKFNTDAGN